VARTPKNFVIDAVQTGNHRGNWIRIGRSTAVPEEFTARFSLYEHEVLVFVVVRVDPGGQARILDLRVVVDEAGETITTTTLRKVLVDQLLRAALSAATTKIEDRPDAHPDIEPAPFQIAAGDDRVYWSPPPGASDKVAQAADAYREALASGSRAPTAAVAEALGYSRAQASRYIRAARDAGLLPRLEER
jgi:hypothetical protein